MFISSEMYGRYMTHPQSGTGTLAFLLHFFAVGETGRSSPWVENSCGLLGTGVKGLTCPARVSRIVESIPRQANAN